MGAILRTAVCFFVDLKAKKKEEFIFFSEDFPLSIIYGSPLLSCDEQITFKRFPPTKIGPEKVITKLFNFKNSVDFPEVYSKMSLYGFCPGGVEELSSFGSCHPQIQAAFEPIALGSVYENKFNNVSYSVMFSRKENKIVPCFTNETWSPYNTFLGVRI